VIDLTRLFDLNTDPQAKEKLLSGAANFFQCPNCQHQGIYPTPIVYHDPEKELLLTYFPPELNTPINEQEKTIGPLIKKAMDDLPAEKRKGYLFKPQTMLSQQKLFETILEADGITPEMLKAQQEKLNLLQRLAAAPETELNRLIVENDEKIDEELFILLSRLAQASAASGDQEAVMALAALQKALLEQSTVGKAAAHEAAETKAAMEELQELGKAGITRENLLDLLIKNAENEIRVTTIASMARGGLDYTFFQNLTEKIDQAAGAKKSKLEGLRERLLVIVDTIDKAVQAQTEEAQTLLDELLAAENIEEATQKALPRVNPMFTEVINHAATKAQEENDTAKLTKLAGIVAVLQAASSSGAIIEIIETLLQEENEAKRQEILEQAGDAINEEFSQTLTSLIGQVEKQGQQPELLARLKALNSEILRFTMRRNLNNGSKPVG
jgi:hypothetical protein